MRIVCGMFMSVGVEKKIMGWRNDMLGPGRKEVVNAGHEWRNKYDLLFSVFQKKKAKIVQIKLKTE